MVSVEQRSGQRELYEPPRLSVIGTFKELTKKGINQGDGPGAHKS
jgi:hypothetical protein